MNIDLANVPPVPIQIGVAGENAFRTITFDASTWGADFPDATYTVVYKRSDGYIYPVLVNAAADAIVWSPTDTDTAVSGNGQIEVRLLDGKTIGKTIVMQTFVAPSLSGDESEPSTPAPDWVNDVAADADRAEAAVEHYPKIVNGVWFVWDATQSEFVSTGINAQGEDGVSPTVTVTAIEGGHRVTITDASGGHVFDVMDGESGSGFGSIVYVTIGEDGKASMSASEILAAVDAGKFPILKMLGVNVPYITNDDTGYNKPVFGLSAIGGNNSRIDAIAVTVKEDKTCSLELVESPTKTSDLTNDSGFVTAQQAAASAPVQSVNGKTGTVVLGASDVHALPDSTVIPPTVTEQTVAGWGFTKNTGTYSKPSGGIPKSDLASAVQTSIGKADTAVQPSAISGMATETYVQQQIAAIPDELPAVTASDNGKFLRVVSGAWAAETVSTWQGGSY